MSAALQEAELECVYCQTSKPISNFTKSQQSVTMKSKQCRTCSATYSSLRQKHDINYPRDFGSFEYYERAFKFYQEWHDVTNGFSRIPERILDISKMSRQEFEASEHCIHRSNVVTLATPKPNPMAITTLKLHDVMITLDGSIQGISLIMNKLLDE